MSSLHHVLFPTPLGSCGLIWSDRGIRGVHLPEATDAATRAQIRQRYAASREGQPPPFVRRAIALIETLFQGGKPQLDDLELDLRGISPFCRKVYEAARGVPPGTTVTYGEIASRIGAPGAARAVGQALGNNPLPIVVPCHRVWAAGGKPGGFTAHGGVAAKRRMLACELGQTRLPEPPGDCVSDSR